MNDEQFDALAMETLAADLDAPSERVWQRVQERKTGWLPSPKEMLIAWAASAAVLFIALTAISPAQTSDAPAEIAVTDESSYTVAAVTRI